MKRAFATAGLVLSFCAMSAFAESWSGVVGDDACGLKHKAGTEADAKCAQTCIKKGGKAVFVSGDKVYAIENQDAIKGHEGHKVTITGKMTGDSIHVDSVKM